MSYENIKTFVGDYKNYSGNLMWIKFNIYAKHRGKLKLKLYMD